MKRIALWAIGLTGAIVLIGAGIFYFLINDGFTEASEETNNDQQEETTEPQESNDQNNNQQEEITGLQEGNGQNNNQEEEDNNWADEELVISSEEEFQTALHRMTHQKVEASQKWGAIRITEERINKMLQTAEEANYTHGDFYISVLTDWANGDFSNAVEVHNRIWRMQGGTIGKATGLLSEAEEQAYIEEYFE